MKKILLIMIPVVVVAAAAVWFFALRDNNKSSTESTNSDSSSTTSDPNDIGSLPDAPVSNDNGDSSSDEAPSVTITYTDSGFNEVSYQAQSGATITVQNNSDSVLDFASNDHPTHTVNSEYNLGTIEPGSSKSFTVKTKGTWGFHNHNNDSHGGNIVVQ